MGAERGKKEADGRRQKENTRKQEEDLRYVKSRSGDRFENYCTTGAQVSWVLFRKWPVVQQCSHCSCLGNNFFFYHAHHFGWIWKLVSTYSPQKERYGLPAAK